MTTIAYVNVFVSDLALAVEFYEQTLGLEKEFAELEFGYASFAAGPIRLGLAVAGEDQQALVGRHTGIGLSSEDLQADYTRLVDKGVNFSMPPQKQPWGGFMALMNDPDGNVFYLDQVDLKHG
jgi:predicted enzyme related to lactoylglutathione lyase